ncbi:RNA polymerase sigma factor, sigma-70 family [Ruminococcaceae bacterium FB2012]|nr:RNA polymerase sigma factor, sigma-70 family [Ruminococcaceae bacterium FB2012]
MKAYIVIINRNKAINKYNENKRRAQNIDYDDLEEQVTPKQLDLFEFEGLHSAIKKLPDKYKDIIYLYDLMDVPVETIADLLHITEDAVYKRVSRARTLIKRLLEAGEKDE